MDALAAIRFENTVARSTAQATQVALRQEREAQVGGLNVRRGEQAAAQAGLVSLRAVNDAAFDPVNSARDDNNEFGEFGRESEGINRQPSLANLVRDPQFVNDLLEETQGVNTPLTGLERLQQVQRFNDAYERSFFISAMSSVR